MDHRRLTPLLPLLLFILLLPFLFRIHGKNKTSGGADTVNPSIAAPLGVAADLNQRLAKFKPIEMPFSRAALSDREQQLVQKLVDAANRIEQIYWLQSDPDGLNLYVRLQKSKDPLDKKVARLMKINGSRYDLID